MSYSLLLATIQSFALGQVWSEGSGNLKQFLIQWCQHHPVFADFEVGAWCRRLTDHDLPGHQIYKFCFEHTPN